MVFWHSLTSPAFHFGCLAIIGTAAIESLIAVWAATSRRHWFWRVLVVWSGVALLVPIRAYEPALLFAASGAAIWITLILTQQVARRLTKRRVNPCESPPAVRFGLRDLFMLLMAIGIWLALVLEAWSQSALIAWGGFVLYVGILAAIAVLSYWVVGWHELTPSFRVLNGALLLVSIAASAAAIARTGDWLQVGPIVAVYLIPGVTSPPLSAVVYLVILLTLLQIAAFLVAGGCLYRRRTGVLSVPQLAAGVALAVFFVPYSLLYWQMLWLAPVPPSPASEPNHFNRIQAIVDEVNQLNPLCLAIADVRAGNVDASAANRLEALYGELLSLLDAPNAVILDLPDQRTVRTLKGIQSMRDCGRCLDAEAKHAALMANYDSCVDFNLALVRLGRMLQTWRFDS
jgi:hypothetical protein